MPEKRIYIMKISHTFMSMADLIVSLNNEEEFYKEECGDNICQH